MMSIHDDIKLKKIGDPEEIKLPHGIFVIKVEESYIFVRRIGGRFMPVSKQEQDELCQQFLH
jgi:hypothetical protein